MSSESIPPMPSRAISPVISVTESMYDYIVDTLSVLAPARPGDAGEWDDTSVSNALREASLEAPEDTRLILSFPGSSSLDKSTVVPLEHTIGTWDVVGIVQDTQNVRFEVDIVANAGSDDVRLSFAVYYDPGHDSCVIRSRTEFKLTFVNMDESGMPIESIQRQELVRLSPGSWKVLDHDQRHLTDILILRKRFVVTIDSGNTCANPLSDGKRKDYRSSELTATKRARTEGDDDKMEIIFAPQIPARAIARRAASTASTSLGSPLALAENGDTINVRTIAHRSGGRQPTRASLQMPATTSPYTLGQVQMISENINGSVYYAAHSKSNEQRVVAKIIKYQADSTAALIHGAHAWNREIRFLKQIRHEHIVKLISTDARVFAIYLEALPPSLERNKYINPTQPIHAHIILRDMAHALSYLVDHGICHNDIKPGNISFSPARGAVLLDFGLATDLRREGTCCGTLFYIPPEYMESGRCDQSGDIWALGITMLYVLGKIPLPDNTERVVWDHMRIQEEGEDQGKMMNWINRLLQKRDRLNREQLVESLVWDMLHPRRKHRIQAHGIAEAFEERYEY